MNQLVLVGRLVRDPELKNAENGIKYSNITLAVPRNFKNSEGVYETDFVDVKLWDSAASNTAEYCKKGDIVGVRGRIQTNIVEKEDDKREKFMDVIAERITFLSSSRDKPSQELATERG